MSYRFIRSAQAKQDDRSLDRGGKAMTNKTLKIVSFILACVMLAVAIATIVCLYVGTDR